MTKKDENNTKAIIRKLNSNKGPADEDDKSSARRRRV